MTPGTRSYSDFENNWADSVQLVLKLRSMAACTQQPPGLLLVPTNTHDMCAVRVE